MMNIGVAKIDGQEWAYMQRDDDDNPFRVTQIGDRLVTVEFPSWQSMAAEMAYYGLKHPWIGEEGPHLFEDAGSGWCERCGQADWVTEHTEWNTMNTHHFISQISSSSCLKCGWFAHSDIHRVSAWTTEKPTEDGWYWVRFDWKTEPEIMRINQGHIYKWGESGFSPSWKYWEYGGEFQGPLKPQE